MTTEDEACGSLSTAGDGHKLLSCLAGFRDVAPGVLAAPSPPVSHRTDSFHGNWSHGQSSATAWGPAHLPKACPLPPLGDGSNLPTIYSPTSDRRSAD